MRAIVRRLAATFALVGAPANAHAHLVNTRLGDFYGGMLHPLTGFQDPLPWLALAILAALQGPRRARWLLVAFPVGLLVGGGLSLIAPGVSFIPLLDVALIALIGMAVAAAVVMPLPAVIGLGVVIGLAHGYQNGQAMTESTDHLLFISGVTAIGYASITMATACATAFLQGSGSWRLLALRASGSWVAAVGIMAFGLQFVAPATH
ncbi:HupE/UreJ family protein [Methylocapsa aurea]|uniref:HupE/UreJ family protein n=1 Tax=Methylocapsa aurea TaxID=663610 RepID=UPI0005636D58|nr:HupE/UreJ family protein [Methylocapsa aurea]